MTCQLVALVGTRGHHPQSLTNCPVPICALQHCVSSRVRLCVFANCLLLRLLRYDSQNADWPTNEEYLQLISIATKWHNSLWDQVSSKLILPKMFSFGRTLLASVELSAYMSLLQMGGTKKDLLSCSHLGTLTGFLIGRSIVDEWKAGKAALEAITKSLVAQFQNDICDKLANASKALLCSKKQKHTNNKSKKVNWQKPLNTKMIGWYIWSERLWPDQLWMSREVSW